MRKAGKTVKEISAEFGRSKFAIKSRLGLLRLRAGVIDHEETEVMMRARLRKEDDRFVQAMTAAIKRGKERAMIGTRTDRSDSAVRSVRASTYVWSQSALAEI
jgi:hypothetical protein